MKFLSLCILFIIGCSKPSEEALNVQQKRLAKDESFRKAKTSPLSDEEKKVFKGLSYFKYDDDFRVEATLVQNDSAPIFAMPTTHGTKKFFRYVGDLQFKIYDQSYSLRALKATFYKSNYFFVPFKDETTSKSTYFTGRYMEVYKNKKGSYTIDFNTAYNPWCNYSDAYNCPIPVSFNHLDIEIEAGEKIYSSPL